MSRGSGRQHDRAAFLADCAECGTCRPACPFLIKSGGPKDVILNHPEDAFLCANCGACNALCPSGLSPADALLTAKQDIISLGRIPRPVMRALRSARRFVSISRGVLFAHYVPSATVFWPGCGLGAMSPRLVSSTMRLLRDHIDPDMGVVFDCCGDPLFQLGDLDGADTVLRDVERKLEAGRVKKVITGCANCLKLLSRYLEGIEVKHVLTVLPEISPIWPGADSVFIHHPCAASLDPAVTGAATSIFPGRLLSFDRPIHPMCCGRGGGLKGFDPALSRDFARRVLEPAAGKAIATYCASCRDALLESGTVVYHLLEGATGVNLSQKRVPARLGWWNRFLLRASRRFCRD